MAAIWEFGHECVPPFFEPGVGDATICMLQRFVAEFESLAVEFPLRSAGVGSCNWIG